MISDYTYNELIKAYRSLGLVAGDVIYVTGNLAKLGRMDKTEKKKETLQRHLDALIEIIGHNGTLMMPTFTFYLCNTDRPYSPQESKCETGALPEFLRKQPNTFRSLHPYSSFVAFGKYAEFLCTDNARSAYGTFSPFDRLLNFKGKNISIGMRPETTCSMIHHAEQTMNVPYRYMKEFVHPILQSDGTLDYKEFYLYCLYRDLVAERDKNQKIMASFRRRHPVCEKSIGKDIIFAYSYNDFFEASKKSMKEDPYIWLRKPPAIRPFRK